MPKISIIMPSLNVARYYKQCIESVLVQSYSDIEILCIDAGSTDGTVETIAEYALQDSRVKYIHSDIRSYGYQINLGIEKAQGDYIGIVETDDFVEADAYESLLNAIEKSDCDYVKGTALFLDGRNIYEAGDYHTPLGHSGIPFGEVILSENPSLQYTDRFIWLGLYKKSLMKQIKLNESAGAAYQDVDFALQLHSKAHKAMYIDKVVYNYRTFAIGSSTVNHKAFKYLADEYDYCKPLLDTSAAGFRDHYVSKLIDQTRNRYITMAATEGFWEEQITEMNRVRKVIEDEIAIGYKPECYLDNFQQDFLRRLRESAHIPYDYFYEENKSAKSKLKDLRSSIVGQEIVLAGCGKRSAFAQALVEKFCADKILAYADNGNNGHQELRGIPLITVEDACNKYGSAVYVVTSLKYAAEMEQQLLEYGIQKEHIVILNVERNNNLLDMIL